MINSRATHGGVNASRGDAGESRDSVERQFEGPWAKNKRAVTSIGG